MKVALNGCYGGFSLSHKGMMRYAELKGIKLYPFKHEMDEKCNYTYIPISNAEAETEFLVHYGTVPNPDPQNDTDWFCSFFCSTNIEERTDPFLIQTIEELGKDANGSCAKIYIEDVPAGTVFRIVEYDGLESLEYKENGNWFVAQ